MTRTDLPGLGAVEQVTYAGWPLYRFFRDEVPGETEGANLNDPVVTPAGIWYLLNPRGGIPQPVRLNWSSRPPPSAAPDPRRPYWRQG